MIKKSRLTIELDEELHNALREKYWKHGVLSDLIREYLNGLVRMDSVKRVRVQNAPLGISKLEDASAYAGPIKDFQASEEEVEKELIMEEPIPTEEFVNTASNLKAHPKPGSQKVPPQKKVTTK